MTWTSGRPFLDDQGSLRNGWKLLGFLLLLNGVGMAVTPLIRLWPAAWQTLLPGRWFDVLICLFATWACLRLEKAPLSSIGLRPRWTFLRDLGLGTLGGILLIGLSALGVFAFDGFHWVRTPAISWMHVIAGAWLFLAVACFEEICFRGYPFQRLVRGLGFGGAQALFAALFALLHWGNPGMAGATKAWATVNIGLASILLALCWRRTGSLVLPIGVHLGWNWAQGSLLGFGVSGTSMTRGFWMPVFHDRPEWLTGGAFGLEASVICTVVCGAGILGLWRWKGVATADASTASAS